MLTLFNTCTFARFRFAMIFALLTLASTESLLAQGALSCVANSSVPPQIRSEGLTELVGDIVLNCSGGVPTAVGQPIPQFNLTIFLNTTVTSRILGNNGSEALLLVDEPGSVPNPRQQLCPSGSLTGCVVTGTGGSSEPFNGDANRPNIFQGTVSNNSVTFAGIPLDPPGSMGTRIYRITNIRANATTIPPSGVIPGQVVALISANPSNSLPINNPQQIVGFVTSGLTFAAGAITVPQCTGITSTNQLAILSFTENFPTSFKPRTAAGPAGAGPQNIPGLVQNNESGFIFPGLPGAGLADFGTRFRAVLRNVPNAVSVWVSTTNVGATNVDQPPTARLVPSETSAYSPIVATTTMLGIPAVQLPVVNGSVTAVWEVSAANPLSSESFAFAAFFSLSGTLDLNTPAATVDGSFAPAPPTFSASDGVKAQPAAFPVPRFVDTSTPSAILSVTACRTNLLFPFVTAQSGFDTGIAISNTSRDPFGTTSQSGTCTLNFYGVNAPASIVTPPVASGAAYTILASATAPNFQGYAIAVCNFQFGHGFAFVSDVGARNLAMGYLGLIIPDPPTPRYLVPFECGAGAFVIGCGSAGEQLGY